MIGTREAMRHLVYRSRGVYVSMWSVCDPIEQQPNSVHVIWYRVIGDQLRVILRHAASPRLVGVWSADAIVM